MQHPQPDVPVSGGGNPPPTDPGIVVIGRSIPWLVLQGDNTTQVPTTFGYQNVDFAVFRSAWTQARAWVNSNVHDLTDGTHTAMVNDIKTTLANDYMNAVLYGNQSTKLDGGEFITGVVLASKMRDFASGVNIYNSGAAPNGGATNIDFTSGKATGMVFSCAELENKYAGFTGVAGYAVNHELGHVYESKYDADTENAWVTAHAGLTQQQSNQQFAASTQFAHIEGYANYVGQGVASWMHTAWLNHDPTFGYYHP